MWQWTDPRLNQHNIISFSFIMQSDAVDVSDMIDDDERGHLISEAQLKMIKGTLRMLERREESIKKRISES